MKSSTVRRGEHAGYSESRWLALRWSVNAPPGATPGSRADPRAASRPTAYLRCAHGQVDDRPSGCSRSPRMRALRLMTAAAAACTLIAFGVLGAALVWPSDRDPGCDDIC